MCNCPVFLKTIIDEVLNIDVDPAKVRIKYQDSEKNKGRTDLEITDDELFYFIIEANPSLLIASQIKPWASSIAEEKLDSENGFLLCLNHDALFDGGFISFDDSGQIIISDRLSTMDCTFTNVNPCMKISLSDKNREYLKFHRENIYE